MTPKVQTASLAALTAAVREALEQPIGFKGKIVLNFDGESPEGAAAKWNLETGGRVDRGSVRGGDSGHNTLD